MKPLCPLAILCGRHIAELRVAHGWSQSELAKRVGVSQATVSNWELGGGMTLASLWDVALALQTQPHVLLRPEHGCFFHQQPAA